MRYWIYITSYAYWFLTLVFCVVTFFMSFSLLIPNIGAHGEPPPPFSWLIFLQFFVWLVLFGSMSFVSYAAGRQYLIPTILTNVFLCLILVTMEANYWFYTSFLVSIPPILIVLYRPMNIKCNKAHQVSPLCGLDAHFVASPLQSRPCARRYVLRRRNV